MPGLLGKKIGTPLRVLMFPNTKKFKITPFYAKMIK